MKKNVLKLLSLTIAMAVSSTTIIPTEVNPYVITAEAHSGRTDSNGGHRDNKNKSGLGSYHYHCGGYPAHLHTNGVCPYGNSGGSSSATNTTVNNNINMQPVETAPAETAESLGWKQDSVGWWYKDSDSTYKKDGVYSIDGYRYLFNADGYMMTGWQEINGYWYYFDQDGHMLIDVCTPIDGTYYYFDMSGRWDEENYDSYSEYEDQYGLYPDTGCLF